jgi:hypothetical protein
MSQTRSTTFAKLRQAMRHPIAFAIHFYPGIQRSKANLSIYQAQDYSKRSPISNSP